MGWGAKCLGFLPCQPLWGGYSLNLMPPGVSVEILRPWLWFSLCSLSCPSSTLTLTPHVAWAALLFTYCPECHSGRCPFSQSVLLLDKFDTF